MFYMKTPQEIEIMRQAGRIVAMAHEKIREAIRPGVTTLELDKIAEDVIRSNGASPSFLGYPCGIPGGSDFPASICASINEEVVHGLPGLTKLKDGDIISIDIGAYWHGYHGDAAMTHAVGNVSPLAEKLIRVTQQSFFEGIRFAREGYRLSEVSAAIEDHVKANGFSVVRDYVGHGIGKDMHERPEIPNYRTVAGGRPRLQQGMTLAIEPMVNAGTYEVRTQSNKWTVVTKDGSLSAHYENTIAVTDGEPMILTAL